MENGELKKRTQVRGQRTWETGARGRMNNE